MKHLKSIFFAFILISLATSCKKEKLDSKSVFTDTQIEQNDLDKYIYKNLTQPYNIQILYKYVDRESDLNYHLVPAPYEGSVRMTKLLIYLGLEPYDKVTGSKQFIRSYFPKLLNYIGTVAVRNNGTVVLGTAESGTKITMYNLINLNATNGNSPSFLNTYYFKTIHHEFQHILNQTKPFPSNFREITGTKYVDDAWNTVYTTTGAAVADGFVSPYASKSGEEDFAELFSFYVTRSQADFDAILNSTGSTAAGRTIVNTKLNVVKNYMKGEWAIDMDVLRQEMLTRFANLSSFDQTTLN
ncbi:zinc-binding metallopeptidase [Sphingobacterium spiritivorum]|uniref:Substrate import-associated zinc metallohydrolase lipoprotein n=1 Tax=Sphingobacterium spiritivorum ATCC 33861 TaxID=525373 RepID=D7VJG5_SPHSI|nr:putative zinc-binding metallopeptidase [Sphingobacterium spiritivorum]EFK59018.1 hypothetical protein HMPREF0766_11134 [Sphingobacterium spiritivorum ATCC 33861]QQT36877.1 putative zinc-binding metallopeptidase [Sphingobacterium spiritivorum]WQD33635.1 putative zinc-binding metallopeptidase [Sphingobacterium spiritivorum]SUJ25527.1 Uncharacterised protein [Sphingobacterium spiritivorum]